MKAPPTLRDGLRAFVAFALAAVLGLAAPLGTALLFGWVVPRGEAGALGWLALGMGMAALAASALEWTGGRSWLRMAGRWQRTLEPGIWRRLLSLPAARLHRGESALESAGRAQALHEALAGLGKAAPCFQQAVAIAGANLLFMVAIDPMMATVGALCALVTFALLLAVAGRRRAVSQEEERLNEALVSGALEWLRRSDQTRVAGRSREEEERLAGVMATRLHQSSKSARGETGRAALLSGASALPPLILFAASDRTELEIGPFLAFLVAFGLLVGSLRTIAGLWPLLMQMRAQRERMRPVWEVKERLEAPREEKVGGDLKLEALAFGSGEKGERQLFGGLSLEITQGEMVMLSGPVGCGKTALLRLIAGLEEPQEGRIFLGNRVQNSETLRRNVAMVGRHDGCFSGSLLANLSGGRKITLEEAWHAAELAGLAGEIRRLPMQMQTVVAEGGANFSSSQCQRLLMARAFARRPQVLLLDHPMRFLSPTACSLLLETIKESGLTCLFTAPEGENLPAGVSRVIPWKREWSEGFRVLI